MMQKEVLGFYRSSHPLAEYAAKLSQFCNHTTADIPDVPERGEVILGGMLSAIKFAHVKKARPGSTATKYANFDLEDRTARSAASSGPKTSSSSGIWSSPKPC